MRNNRFLAAREAIACQQQGGEKPGHDVEHWHPEDANPGNRVVDRRRDLRRLDVPITVGE